MYNKLLLIILFRFAYFIFTFGYLTEASVIQVSQIRMMEKLVNVDMAVNVEEIFSF